MSRSWIGRVPSSSRSKSSGIFLNKKSEKIILSSYKYTNPFFNASRNLWFFGSLNSLNSPSRTVKPFAYKVIGTFSASFASPLKWRKTGRKTSKHQNLLLSLDWFFAWSIIDFIGSFLMGRRTPVELKISFQKTKKTCHVNIKTRKRTVYYRMIQADTMLLRTSLRLSHPV